MPRVVFATFSGQKDLGRRGQHTDLSKILLSVVCRQGAREPGFVAIAEKVTRLPASCLQLKRGVVIRRKGASECCSCSVGPLVPGRASSPGS